MNIIKSDSPKKMRKSLKFKNHLLSLIDLKIILNSILLLIHIINYLLYNLQIFLYEL
ncbi:MAG: hypothetical protein BAJALOKI1v1_820006 [Promethearchaeota archaeon]|nr:MAG: hypothetical protein BAJALOKI1v1_820006 [Candidatus Lokiarchaeota archaeon]